MLRIIAIFILIYLVFRIVFTFILPWIARWYLKRYRNRFYRDNPDAAEAAERRKEKRKQYPQRDETKKPDTDQLGEYVDFEEVEDEDKDNDQAGK